MSLFTYLQRIPSTLARRKRLRSLPSITLEELGLSELANPLAERPPLTMQQYVDFLSGAPLPTDEQKRNFVEYVAHAHSWYKHLPLYPPGAPFYFFIDKYVACDRLVNKDGTAILKERADYGFHYSDYPTAEYRRLFGHLAYCCGYGKKVIPLGNWPVAIPRDDLAAVPDDNAELYRLPSEVVDAGVARLTRVIHLNSALFPYWLARVAKKRNETDWPSESGRESALEKIFSRCEELLLVGAGKLQPTTIELAGINRPESVDPVLYELVSPERTRQLEEMMKAIDRVCELIALHRS